MRRGASRGGKSGRGGQGGGDPLPPSGTLEGQLRQELENMQEELRQLGRQMGSAPTARRSFLAPGNLFWGVILALQAVVLYYAARGGQGGFTAPGPPGAGVSSLGAGLLGGGGGVATAPPIPPSQLAPPLRVVFPNITDWRPRGSPVLRNSLEAVIAAFAAHGYVEVPLEWEEGEGGEIVGRWDVMWSYHYPFKMFYRQMRSLQPHQRVNHFPGPGAYFSNKTVLATHSAELSCTPRAFQLPTQYDAFAAFAAEHPGDMWVVKSAGHRGVRVVTPDEVPRDTSRMFVQRYVRDALLIDNHRFDMGVYVAITSLNPLRVYVFDDVLMRFCMSEYDPSRFDPGDLDTYVIADKYIPPWDMPSLEAGFARGLTTKGAILEYWESRGVDGARLFANLHAAVAEVLTRFEPSVFRAGSQFPRATAPFFEMFRFDFIVDDGLRPWLMEANMSPNLSASKTAGLRNMFSRISYDLLSLAGLAVVDRTRPQQSLRSGQPYERYNAGDLAEPGGRLCADDAAAGCDCEDTLAPCHVCSYCGGGVERASLLAKASEEHLARRGFLRVPIDPERFTDTTTMRRNRLLHTWYRLRCQQDPAWC